MRHFQVWGGGTSKTYHGENGNGEGRHGKGENNEGDGLELRATLNQQSEDGAADHDAHLCAHVQIMRERGGARAFRKRNGAWTEMATETHSQHAASRPYHEAGKDHSVGEHLTLGRAGVLHTHEEFQSSIEMRQGVRRVRSGAYLVQGRSPHEHKDVHGALEERLGQAQDGDLGVCVHVRSKEMSEEEKTAGDRMMLTHSRTVSEDGDGVGEGLRDVDGRISVVLAPGRGHDQGRHDQEAKGDLGRIAARCQKNAIRSFAL